MLRPAWCTHRYFQQRHRTRRHERAWQRMSCCVSVTNTLPKRYPGSRRSALTAPEYFPIVAGMTASQSWGGGPQKSCWGEWLRGRNGDRFETSLAKRKKKIHVPGGEAEQRHTVESTDWNWQRLPMNCYWAEMPVACQAAGCWQGMASSNVGLIAVTRRILLGWNC